MIEFKLNAKGKKIGRLASEIAKILLGKNSPEYAPNKVADNKVIIENIELLDINEKKKQQKIYDSYSGFPGGRKEITLGDLIEKKGVSEALKNAVYGMLPKNKLRDKRIKNLIINK